MIYRFFLFLVLFSFSQSGFSQIPPPDMEKILQRGKLFVGVVDRDVLPFFGKDLQGELVGSDIKIAKDIAKRLGIEVVFNRTATTYDELIELVAKHEVDVAISQLSETLERAKIVSFTNPYLILHQGILVNRKSLANLKRNKPLIETLNSSDVSIGILKKSSYVKFGEDLFPKAKKIYYDNWDETQKAVIRQEVTASLVDEIVLRTFSRFYPDGVIQVETVVLQDAKDPICMSVPWDSTHFLYWLNLFIKETDLFQSPSDVLKSYVQLLNEFKAS